MKNAIFLVVSLLTFTEITMAGCDSGRGQCYYYVGSELKSSGGCEVSVCANVESYIENWQWDNGSFVTVRSRVNIEGMLINGKPGRAEENSNTNGEKLDCYTVKGTFEKLCNDAGMS